MKQGVDIKLTTDLKDLDDKSKKALKEMVDANKSHASSLDEINKQLTGFLESHEIKDAEAQNKIKKAIGLDIPPPPGTPPAGTTNR